MKMKIGKGLLLILLFLGYMVAMAQEEESAEVFLEEYTDEFQEMFFEALKQKGIENYDKAINLMLECKQMQPDIKAIDHELAKLYLLHKDAAASVEYSLDALAGQPENYWYANTLADGLRQQGRTFAEVQTRAPFGNELFKQNLSLILFRLRDFKQSLALLKELNDQEFVRELSSKIKDSMDAAAGMVSPDLPEENETDEQDPLEKYRTLFTRLWQDGDYQGLKVSASEAIELFPSQPYYYLMLGKAEAAEGNHRQAVRILESALDFLLEDTELANQIYKQLAGAYRDLGDPEKSNMYLSKVKNGS